MKSDYESALFELQKADDENKEAIDSLTSTYESKVAQLEASDKANAEALEELKADYESKVAELNGKITANATEISELEAALAKEISDAKSDYNAKISATEALISALQEADLDNVRRIASLEAKVEALLSKHEHTFGEWINYIGNENVYCENRLFYRICKECSVLEWKRGTYENHDFEITVIPPTCLSKGYDVKTCKICGLVEKENEKNITDHKWETEFSYDESYHWLDCEYCDETDAHEEHNVDDSGYCVDCNQPIIVPTKGIVYEKSADGSYATVVAYSGTATKIVIADTYEGAPVRIILGNSFRRSSITSVTIPSSVTTIGYDAFSYCRELESVTIGNGVEIIEYRAFSGCTSLKSVTIPDSITTIGYCAFYDCSSLKYNEYDNVYYLGNNDNPYFALIGAKESGITSCVINERTKVIADDALSCCYSLKSVIIPDSVTTIGEYAFNECTRLESITVDEDNTAYKSIDGNLYTKDGKTLIQYAIGKTATSFTFPDSVTTICGYAFYGCSSLENATIPDNVITIGEWAYCGCDNLLSVVLGNNVTTIGDYAFEYCDSLESVIISNNVTTIGFAAFENCYSLESIIIPNSVTSIGSFAFSCSGLKNIVIPESVTIIGDCAFCCCDSLTSITIPDSVITIGDSAFSSCHSLNSVYYKGTADEWENIESDLNSDLTGVDIYFFSADEPHTAGKYWYYDNNGDIAVW